MSSSSVWLHTWSLSLLLVFLLCIGWFILNSRTFIGVVESEIIFHSLNNMQDKCKILKNATRKSWKWASSLTDWSCNEETVVVLFEMHQILYQLYLPMLAALLIKGEVLNYSITDMKLKSILWTGGRQCMGNGWCEWNGTELLVGNGIALQIDEKWRFIDLEAVWIHYC